MKRIWASMGLGAALTLMSVGDACAQDPQPPALQPLPPAGTVQVPVRTVRPGAIPDSVYLNNGGLLRGTVYEVMPGDHVSILDVNGGAKLIRWGDVSRVVFGEGTPGATPVPTPVPAVSTSEKPPKVGPMAKVHINSKRGVQLYRQPANGSGWYEACSSPCDEEMPLNDEYRIAGAGIFQSSEFHLEGSPGGQVVLNVDPGTRSGVLAGGILTAVGGLVDYLSLIVLAAGASQSSTCSYDSGYGSSCSSNNDGKGATAAGLAMLAGGTAAMVIGVIIMVANSSTGVSQNESTSKSASLRPLDSYRRDPMWHTAGATMPAATPTLSIPFLSGTF